MSTGTSVGDAGDVRQRRTTAETDWRGGLTAADSLVGMHDDERAEPRAAADTADASAPERVADPEPPVGGMHVFLHVLVNTAVANLTTSFLWFALTFWIYLETRSLLATGVVGGTYMLLVALFSMAFGTVVDRFRKHRVMIAATAGTGATYALGAVIFFAVPSESLLDLGSPWLWILAVVLLIGSVVEQLRNIALSTTVTLLVPSERRPNANGLVGTVQGLAFLVTSVLSGLAVGMLGMGLTILVAIVAVAAVFVHLLFLRIPEPQIIADTGRTSWMDVRGGLDAVRAAPGLFTLVLFTTLNNLIGGVFLALMDPYGLTLFSVEAYGIVLGFASTGFLVGGALIAKFGLGRNPLRTMLLVAVGIGALSGAIAIREWGWLFIAGVWLYMLGVPVIEAAEQSVIQRVVPFRVQGRVFGFAMTFEAAASPITAFLIAPIAEFWIVPYVDSDAGRARFGPLLGEGDARGIALVFLVAGVIGVALVLLGFTTRAYRTLSAQYLAGDGGTAAPEIPAASPLDRAGTPTTPVPLPRADGSATD